jgi:hypothetical protein
LLEVFNLIFEQTDIIFSILQSKSTDISYCKARIEFLLSTLKGFRNDNDFFDKIFDKVITQLGPPRKKRKTDFDGLDGDGKTYFNRLFKEILDMAIMQIEARFSNLSKLNFFELLNKDNFPKYHKNFPHALLDSLMTSYPTLFEKNKLERELQVLYSDPELFGMWHNFSDMFNFIYTNSLQKDVPEIYKLHTITSIIASIHICFSRKKFFYFEAY